MPPWYSSNPGTRAELSVRSAERELSHKLAESSTNPSFLKLTVGQFLINRSPRPYAFRLTVSILKQLIPILFRHPSFYSLHPAFGDQNSQREFGRKSRVMFNLWVIESATGRLRAR